MNERKGDEVGRGGGKVDGEGRTLTFPCHVTSSVT